MANERTERWIKLRLHRHHPRIYELAEEMQCSTADALACTIDWFRQLDADANPDRCYSAVAIDGVSGSPGGPGFCQAALRLGWLERDGTRYRAVGVERWFSDAAKKRLQRGGTTSDNVSHPPTNGRRSLPAGSDSADQTTVESDENREEHPEPVGQNVGEGSHSQPTGSRNSPDESTDTTRGTLQSAGPNAAKLLDDARMVQVIAASGIAKNNAGRAINWLRNVIPDGPAFLRRVTRQATEQGMKQGGNDFARYVYGCIREEAKISNTRKPDNE